MSWLKCARFRFLTVLCICSCSAPSGSTTPEQGLSTRWPRIQANSVKVGIDLSASRTYVDVPLRDTDGRVRYRLICRAGDDAYRAAVERATGVASYQEDLTCLLSPKDAEIDVSLLVEYGSPIWHTRGVFRRAEITGSCAAYPEFGRVRTFKLRGIRLTLSLSESAIPYRETSKHGQGGNIGPHEALEFADLSIDVRPDSTAATAIADRPAFIDPKGDPAACSKPMEGVEPRMCRTSAGSWEICPEGWEYRVWQP